jgi:predicted secreted hydrolase
MAVAGKRIGALTAIILLALTLAACGDQPKEAFPSPTPNPNAGQIVAPSPGPVKDAKLTFPDDEAPHNNLTEWWYYTGHINTTDGAKYGFEYVIFQGIRGNFPVGYVSHFAITDMGKNQFKYDQKITAAAQKVEFGGKNGFNLAVGDWTMRGVSGREKLKAAMTDGSYAFDLDLTDSKGIVLHGTGKFSYGAAGFSYYYSRPRISLSGTLSVDGQTKQIKDGVAWFDHQWGDFIPLAGGWDWFSVHLEDNTELMVYYLRDDQNNLVDLFGSYVPACTTDCNPFGDKPIKSVDLQKSDFIITATDKWTSPRTGGVYPSGWNVKVKAQGVPALDLNIIPVQKDQELDTRRTTSVIYWEGACDVTGTKDGKPIKGQSYVELTGYAKNRQ